MELTFAQLAIIIISSLLLYCYSRRKNNSNLPPGPPTMPIVGNLHLMGKDAHNSFAKLRETYGDVYSFKFGSYPGIVLNGHKVIREALNEMAFSGRHKPTMLFPREGGIGMNSGKEWQDQRRMTMKILRDFGFGKKTAESLMLDEAQELIERFRKLAGEPNDFQNQFNASVLNGLWSMLAGQRFSHDDPRLQKIVNSLNTAIQAEGLSLIDKLSFFVSWMAPLKKILEPPRRISDFVRDSLKLMHEVIEEHKESYQDDQSRDFIDTYLKVIQETSDPASSFYGANGDKHLPVVLFDMFVAGTETTASTLMYTFQYLAIHPELQEKLYREIQTVVGHSRWPSLADRPQMVLTEAILLEVMRHSSLLPRSLLHRATETVTFMGYTIPGDTIIVPNLHSANHDPEVWGDPQNFRPERFVSEDGKSVMRHHEAFMAFSVGKRVCLGETLARDQLFLFISSIVQRLKIKPDPNSPPLKVEYYETPATLSPVPKLLILEERNLIVD